jgi:hypothetical protein
MLLEKGRLMAVADQVVVANLLLEGPARAIKQSILTVLAIPPRAQVWLPSSLLTPVATTSNWFYKQHWSSIEALD